MQLSRLVSFFKTMGDPTRLRMIKLLAEGPLHGQAIAGKLGLTPPTITHHLHKLREVNVVYQRRDGNTIYFYLNKPVMDHYAAALTDLTEQAEKEKDRKEAAERQKVIDHFFTCEGRLKHLPAQRKKKLIVLEHMLKGLKKGEKYEEKQLNEYIKKFHDDYAAIRREFIIHNYMYRENGIYELNPEEMWAKE
ncbi:metalloregulator ArsR/SmtB family transcription factor [Anoxybacillus rupiensis]|uniref:Metalloregulator ArsR/SmtB family transcription factor n=1 Tax=Anoxybacteroides rupiense TaxID=311460 RepID=A0ABT5W5S5_9BACL|nr:MULTISPECIES: metalloregulator ArsR/SmtB family transcription factor [Anoxybacillus]MBB3906992.1 putative transcriptional regulator [Anoxybacillus rupiensis]MBS2771480.1 metalloregulator ArsR/SmtB family transcription factor [Anoxybacillus rupiensis]MDE8564676.1 metalloregulator ArsR/SmtB family transcription factor [Anoxybacillus rupiensis]QHC05126.1 metalloregulator ArsR/SmtB family transcription factor [Anoxybacillus sp. PDR2]